MQNDREDNVRSNKPIKTDGLSIQVIDTVRCAFVDDVPVVGDVYQDSLIAFLNPISGYVRIVDFTGKVISGFNKSGYDHEGFGQYLGGVSFLKDGSLMLLSDVGFYNYSVNGNLIAHHEHSKKIDMTGGLFFSGQLNLQRIENSEGEVTGFISTINLVANSRVNQKDFYDEVTLLNKVTYPAFSYSAVLKYPENSIYRQANGYYHKHYPLFTLANDDILNVIYNLEGIIYQYDLKSMELANTVDIEPDDFTICPPFDFGTGPNDFVVTMKSDYYTNIFSSGDTIMATFSKWFNDNDEIKSSSDMNDKGHQYRKYYLQVFIQSTNRLYEIQLPEHFPHLRTLTNGKLLLMQEVRFMDVEPDTENILIAKLSFPD